MICDTISYIFWMIKKMSEEYYIKKYFYYISIRYMLNYKLLFISKFFYSSHVKYVLLIKINFYQQTYLHWYCQKKI